MTKKARNLALIAAAVLGVSLVPASHFATASAPTQVYKTQTQASLGPHVLTFRAGSFSSKQYFAAQTDAWSFSSPVNSWVNVPSTMITVNVPSGTTRLVDARFNAESLCSGAGWCSLRILYQPYSGGGPVEFFPQSGTDYAFDSPGGAWKSESIERSTGFLGAGNYHVWVQAQLVGGSSPSLRLDDYHLAVELVQP